MNFLDNYAMQVYDAAVKARKADDDGKYYAGALLEGHASCLMREWARAKHQARELAWHPDTISCSRDDLWLSRADVACMEDAVLHIDSDGNQIQVPKDVIGKQVFLKVPGGGEGEFRISSVNVGYDSIEVKASRTNVFLDYQTPTITGGPFIFLDGQSATPTTLAMSSSWPANDSDSVMTISASFTLDAWNAMTMTPAERLRAQIRRNMKGTGVDSRHLNIVKNTDPEYKARGLLRELIGDEAFKNYVRKGFITVKGRTGLVYKVMRGCGSGAIKTYARTKEGKYVPFESICIVFSKNNLPPTDAVIMRLLMIRYDEFAMRAKANVARLLSYEQQKELELGAHGDRLIGPKPEPCEIGSGTASYFVTGDSAFAQPYSIRTA